MEREVYYDYFLLLQCSCTPSPLILVTLTPCSSLHPFLGVLIYSTNYAFLDCARGMLESCSLECQRVKKILPKIKKGCVKNFKRCYLNVLIFL